jgi:SPP1 gp7 family putative phage head morphogenesis protein
VLNSLESALSRGASFEAWKQEFASAMSTWASEPGGRLETAIRTQLQTRYMAARVSGLRAQSEKYPLWRFTAILDLRTSDVCRACNDTVLPADHSWWARHTPPLHFNCRSTIVGLKRGERDPRAPRVKVPEGFGNPEDWVE